MPHKEILTKEQIELLPIVKSFSDDFGLVGGTAIALHLGHRRSIDFDLFSMEKFGNISIKRKISEMTEIEKTFVNKLGEYTIEIKAVRLTFFHYPFKIEFSEELHNIIKIPNLLTLAALKAYALGQRAKWKDYVDLYFIARKYKGIKEICEKAQEIFVKEFNEKLFRAQLAYFADINYSEAIIFMPGFEISDEKIKQELVEFSLA